MTRAKTVVAMLLGVLLLLTASGCSHRPKNVVPVKGKVTLNGQPLSGATVVFTPVAEGGSTSRGRTNDSGEYVLRYAPNVDGALIGEHTVSITTSSSAKGAAEKVPYRYRIPGPEQLKATVNPGQNTIDFNLEPGPIDPPQPKGKRKGK